MRETPESLETQEVMTMVAGVVCAPAVAAMTNSGKGQRKESGTHKAVAGAWVSSHFKSGYSSWVGSSQKAVSPLNLENGKHYWQVLV